MLYKGWIGAVFALAVACAVTESAPGGVPVDPPAASGGALSTPPVVPPEPEPTPARAPDTEASLTPGTWRELAPGLEVAVFDVPTPAPVGDSRVRVVRVDPARRSLVLHAVVAEGGESATARQWADRHGLVAAINPGMFHPDLRATGYLRIGDHVVTETIGKDMDALALDPRESGLPAARIIDRDCEDLTALEPRYGSLIQSIRMLSCRGDNVWKPSSRIWSHAVYGTDGQGRVLLIHCRAPYSTHDFIEILRSLPLDLQRLAYGEGGPEAQLFVRAGDFEGEWFGSYETGFYESDGNDQAWPVPNILGVGGEVP